MNFGCHSFVSDEYFHHSGLGKMNRFRTLSFVSSKLSFVPRTKLSFVLQNTKTINKYCLLDAVIRIVETSRQYPMMCK